MALIRRSDYSVSLWRRTVLKPTLFPCIQKDSILATTFSTHGVDPKGAQKDKALALLAENKIAFDPNSAEAKRVKRKIDLHLMPLVFFVYCLQLMVRVIADGSIFMTAVKGD